MLDEKGIRLTLLSVSEMKFILNIGDTENVDSKSIKVGYIVHLSPCREKETMDMDFRLRLVSGETIYLETTYKFSFKIEDFDRHVVFNDNGSVTLTFLPHMVNVAIGTLRGIILVRTVGTPLSKFVLPITDAVKLSKRIAIEQ